MTDEELVDRIYEAAFLPELWPAILDFLAARTRSCGGVILVADWGGSVRWVSTAANRDAALGFATDPEAQRLAFEWRHAGREFPEFQRSCVETVLRKTGTRQQSQLVALLKGKHAPKPRSG